MKRNRKRKIEAAAWRRYMRETGPARAEYICETRRIGKAYRSFGWPDCELYEDRMEKAREDYANRIADARMRLEAAYSAFWGKDGGGLTAEGGAEEWRH